MIDEFQKVERLMARLRDALPIPARMTPDVLAVAREKAPDIWQAPACRITQVHYAGDEGGVLCFLDPPEGEAGASRIVASITHLRFDARLPMAREIAAYQKHRVKLLRRGAG